MLDDRGLAIPEELRRACRGDPARESWLLRLPELVLELTSRWSLVTEKPVVQCAGACAWVTPARLGSGSRVALKLGMPHLEGEQEIAGLRFWDGDPTVRLLEADEAVNAMVLEWCEPGTPLAEVSAAEQDRVVAGLLRRLWRAPTPAYGFRPLSVMISAWCAETRRDVRRWPDKGLVEEGLHVLEELARPGEDDVLLATDLHAGNVLRAQREPWLVIDPKPFVGDAAYDVTQHLFNRGSEHHREPLRVIRELASLLDLDAERVRWWTFARAAAGPRDRWREETVALARAIRP